MARSHHRKKHKAHLQQFKHSNETNAVKTGKGRSVGLFTIIGAALGFAVSYFATQAATIWMVAGIAAGAVLGYYIGRKVDGDGTV